MAEKKLTRGPSKWIIELIKSDFSSYRTPIFARVLKAENRITTTLDRKQAIQFATQEIAESAIPTVRAAAPKLSWRVAEWPAQPTREQLEKQDAAVLEK